jgi:putative addiction module killer protein
MSVTGSLSFIIDKVSYICDNPKGHGMVFSIRKSSVVFYRIPGTQVEPARVWLTGIKDQTIQSRIAGRIRKASIGHFGDFKSVGLGVFELRFFIGPGYRLYFGLYGDEMILFLCGGDKSQQQADIKRAIKYWQSYLKGENDHA